MIQTAFHTIFHGRVPASRGLLMFAAAAIAVLALSGCVGGGGGGSGGPVVSGGPGTLSPSLTARGVTATIVHNGSPGIAIRKGGAIWTHEPHQDVLLPAPTGWYTETKQNAQGSAGTELFQAFTNINGDSDPDYLAYGYWSRSFPDSANDVQPFYYGKMAYTGNVGGLTGTATYTGGAAGAWQSANPNAPHGRFVADIQMTADFNLEKITGRMTNIRETRTIGTHTPEFRDPGVWSAPISGNSFTGSGPYGGMYSGRFFGPSSVHPTGIAGWFENVRSADRNSAYFANLKGAFGAAR